ncbi:ATP-dependent helicase [Fuerstiella marisgermanici]|uniref:DNA 3'-5' helicase n=1 Tax=Fuerstiella marisgermanici TaxID=1891926 RepID=A0A1P8WS72_9PLAN|nr:UvrD-helicase domain-containing protein [Fuerstiella marisgermanici]APZ96912.1 ATP-dependent DNA helicase PcrA [Fuerstiella marisgermanici]
MTNLTEPQQQAVDHFEGPLMVLAGPGSGKTRVITHRIAKLLARGVAPNSILALTFTNKAAREMAERVDSLLNGVRVEVSTFHRFCARLLRRFHDHVGLKNNFTILDSSDQVALVRAIMKDVGFDTTTHDPRRILNRISKARNDLITAEDFRMQHEERVGDLLDAVVYEVFPEYERLLLHNNCVDFDALLLHVVDMLSGNDELREYLDLQFRFVLVDEYQDTNLAQYRIVRALSQHCPNLCATGDPDQSIYGWRGARPENIVQFEQDFGGTKIVSLDQNFRSTASIVRCADQLISHNPRRHRNALHTDNEEGPPVRMRVYSDGEMEANEIAAEIAELVNSGKRKYSDFAVFYRVNALSRSVETALSRHQVPFQVASGFSFYERAEVRDLIGYLRLIENSSDDVAFVRIVNRPARGIGDKTVQRLTEYARQNGVSLLDAAAKAADIPSLTARSRKPLKGFSDLIHKLQKKAESGNVRKLLERLIDEIDYFKLWKDENDEVDTDRKANIYELLRAAELYEDAQEDAEHPPSLQGFLELAGLTSEADSVDEHKGAVTLMTMHAAKGLEFPVVFVLGVESGLIPHERAIRDGDPASFQEERRLLFVAVTRAMEELNLTQTRQRDFRGVRRYTIASPFIPEMEMEVVAEDDQPAPQMRQPSALDEFVIKAKQRYQAAQSVPTAPKIMSAADLEKKLAAMKAGSAPDDAAGAAGDKGIEADRLRPASFVVESIGQMEAPATSTDADSLFAAGRPVRHPRYGRGVVLEASEGGSRATVTVLFEADDREETFVTAHCPLQPIGAG